MRCGKAGRLQEGAGGVLLPDLAGDMGNYRDILRTVALVGIGLPLAVGGTVLLFRAGVTGSPAGGLTACAVLVVGAVVLAAPLARLAAGPSGRLFWPGKRLSRPLPMYGIPASRRAKGLYEEAMSGYEKIAEEYPGELKPYVEMIDISVVNLRDGERARSIYHRGLGALRKADKAALARVYEATVTRLQPEPEWVSEERARALAPPDLKGRGPVEEPDGRAARRFHAGGTGGYEGSDGPQYVDTRRKVPYVKKEPAGPSGQPDSE